MPSLLRVFSLLALTAISGVLASPQPTRVVARMNFPDCGRSGVTSAFEACGHGHSRSVPEAPSHVHYVPGKAFTNGQRLARHLPLKPPTRRSSVRRAVASSAPAAPVGRGIIRPTRPSSVRRAVASPAPAAPVGRGIIRPTRRSSVRRAVASPAPAAPVGRGIIRVLPVDSNGNVDSSDPLGYVSRTTDQTQYRVETSLDDALLLQPSGHNLVTLNSDTATPAFLGLVRGRDDTSASLAQGSFNYLYLSSTEQTAPNATPQSVGSSYTAAYGGSNEAESAVWSINPENHALTAQWINPDRSNAPTICFVQSSAIYCSGDPNAFNQKYSAPVQRIAFVYVPA